MDGLMMDRPLLIRDIAERVERLFPEREVVSRTHSGVERSTYGEVVRRARRLASSLERLGVKRGDRVATFGWNSRRHLELYLAVPSMGAVLHTLNIRLFAEQLTYIVNHAEDEVIFVDRSLIGQLWPLVGEFPTVRQYVVMDDGKGEVPDDPRIVDYEQLVGDADPVEFHIDDENQAAAMCYTSGTTGNPKGVVYSHRSMFLHSMAVLMADALGISESDVILPVVPMFHANVWGLGHAAPFAGASLIMPGPDLSPGAIADLMESENVTVAAGVPTIWMGVLPMLEGRDLSSLRKIICGGSAVPRSLSEGFRETVGLPITQAWGMTETSPIASVGHIKAALRDRPDDELADLRASQGLGAPAVDLRIVDPESGEEAPWDGKTSGELQARGPWIAADYYNDPRSRESFTDDGWLRTGDVAIIDPEGYIRLVDRTKDLVKSGGEWISSVELENELMAHPKIAEAAVIGVAHERWVERPLACVVVADGEELTKDEVIEFLTPRVVKWWLPDDAVFIEEVPKTSVGKFSKKDLRARFAGYKLPT
jgi:acyl-CoA synthetase (AMP-forming)/AMP-acid ligase II